MAGRLSVNPVRWGKSRYYLLAVEQTLLPGKSDRTIGHHVSG